MKVITGVFFQKREIFRVAHSPVIGSVVVVEPEELRNMFTGVILPEPVIPFAKNNLLIPEGYIFDSYGFANIYQYKETETSVSFIKKYEHRQDTIEYNFAKKDGNEFLGKWKGDETGDGYASCVIVPVSQHMFDITRFNNQTFKDKM